MRPDADDPAWDEIKIGQMASWDELWLDVRKLSNLQTVMGARMDLAAQSGCDGVEPDNIDCFDNEDCWGTMTSPTVASGSEVRAAQVTYDKWLAEYAHSKDLIIAQKNTLDLIPDLVGDYDLAVNEQCLQYDECDTYEPYVTADKAVLHVEYNDDDPEAICAASTTYSLRTKYCPSSDGSVCDTGSTWTNCFAPDGTGGGSGDGDGDGDGDGSSAGVRVVSDLYIDLL